MFITPAALRRNFILKALSVSNSKVLVFLKFKGAPVEGNILPKKGCVLSFCLRTAFICVLVGLWAVGVCSL